MLKTVTFRLEFTLPFLKTSQNKLERLSVPYFGLSEKIGKKAKFSTFLQLSCSNTLQHTFSSLNEKYTISSFNTLTAKYQYSCSNRDNLPLPIQTQFSKKTKIFCCNFIVFLESKLHFEHFLKKTWASQLNYFWNHWLQKTFLFRCIKSPVFENR